MMLRQCEKLSPGKIKTRSGFMSLYLQAIIPDEYETLKDHKTGFWFSHIHNKSAILA
jgi:hypothetical protein